MDLEKDPTPAPPGAEKGVPGWGPFLAGDRVANMVAEVSESKFEFPVISGCVPQVDPSRVPQVTSPASEPRAQGACDPEQEYSGMAASGLQLLTRFSFTGSPA